MIFPLLPFLLASFSNDGRILGLLTGCYAVAQFLATPLIGALSDRYGRKPVIAGCVAGSVLGLGVFSFTIAFDWSGIPWASGSAVPLALLFIGRLIDGVSGGTAATAAAVLADISPPEKRAKAFGLLGVAFGLGFILGPGLGGLLGRYSVNLPLLVAVTIAVFNLTLVLLVLPETHPPGARIPLPAKRDLQPFSQLSRLFANPRVRRLCGAFFCFFLAFSGFTAVLVLYFKQVFGWGPGLAGAAFLVVGVVATVVQGGLLGPLVRRCGEWRLSLAGLGFVAVGMGLVPLARPGQAAAIVFPALVCLALGTGLVTPSLRSLISRRLADDSGQGAALGSLQGLQSLGGFLGPPLAGVAYETLGQTSPFWLNLMLMLAVTVMVAGGQTRRASSP